MLKTTSGPYFLRALLLASVAIVVVACSGAANTQNPLPAQEPRRIESSISSFKIVQTANGYGNVNSTLAVRMPKAPVAGDVLLLFYEYNVRIAQWPATSGWASDAGSNTYTQVMHHVVGSGETGAYTINIGGPGGWAEGYMVVEVSGVNTSQPINSTSVTTVAAGKTAFNFSGTPTTPGTLPIVFLGAHQTHLSWSSISGGWSVAAKNDEYTQELASGPVQSGTSTFYASAALAHASAYPGAADVVLLDPSSTSTPPPAGQSSSPYALDGCRVYTANDWFTTNLVTGASSYVSNRVDPNSAAIISNFNSTFSNPQFNINGTTTSVSGGAVVNRATNSTPLYVLAGLVWGFANDPYNDDPNKQIPWTSSFLDGNSQHTIVLNTQTCVDYEAYGSSWNGSRFSAADGYVHNLNHPFNDQYLHDSGLMTKSGVPQLGTLDVGEDASASSINHIAYMLIPGSDGSSAAAGGYVAPATAGATCSRNCTNKIPFGARLRLNSSKYACPNSASYPQAHKICVQLETYGAIVMDHDGVATYGIRLSETAGGSNPWNQSDVMQLNGIPLSDWDVMSLGTVH